MAPQSSLSETEFHPKPRLCDAKALEDAASYLRKRFSAAPEIGVILGSGFGALAEDMEGAVHIPYKEIPGFLHSEIPGHAGEALLGQWHGKPTMLLSGRSHYYEGYSAYQIAFPIRVLKAIGAHTVILTAAAGSMRKNIKPGSLVTIYDHMNFIGDNPLRGYPRSEPGEFFADLADAYSPQLIQLAHKAARSVGVVLHKGIYVAYAGPSYETPAEIRAFRGMGGDIVGMSIAPEAIMAKRLGLKVLTVICAANYAPGIIKGPLTHGDVIATIHASMGDMKRLTKRLIPMLPQAESIQL